MTGNTWSTQRERYDRMLQPFGDALLRAAALRPGEHVIDVGCGTGTSALQAIEQLMPGGALVGIDINPDLTNIATHRSRDIDGLTIVTADATSYRPTQDVDAIISRFGTMLCTDPVGAHRNLAAGLRPGGRLVCVVWQAPNRNLWHALPEHAIRAHLDLEWPDVTEAPGPFALADPARIEWLLHEASLHVVRIDSIEARCWIAADIDGAIDFFDATSRQLLHPSASAETIDAIHRTLRASLEPYQTCAGIEVPSSAWLIEATRP